jgi:hypothetical protein
MDFEEIMQIVEASDIKIKLTVFRGPAESLYGPSYGSGERLDEYVPERGEEAALQCSEVQRKVCTGRRGWAKSMFQREGRKLLWSKRKKVKVK